MLSKKMKKPLLLREICCSATSHHHNVAFQQSVKNSIAMTKSKRLPLSQWWPQSTSRTCLMILAIFSAVQLLPMTSRSPAVVFCQDFEDLNNNNHKQGNHQQPSHHHTFQPLSRQSQQQQQQQQQVVQNAAPINNKYSNIIRPILSNRFAPASSANSQQLTAQASFSSSVFSGPPPSLAGAPVSSSVSVQQLAANQPQTSSVSNIEQLMKNALARTAQMNSATAEPRQDTAASSVSVSASAPPEKVESSAPISRQRGEQQQAVSAALPPQSSPVSSDKIAEPSETSSAEAAQTSSSENESDKTTVAQTVAPNVHETVYTDQRFANLFARRNNNAKKRITPMEQVKAKPTLPSFIKSLPDPKQFTAVQVSEKPVTPSSFASQRLLQQQNQQGRLVQQQGQLQKKPAITSNSAALASNKKANSLNGKPLPSSASSATGPKASSISTNPKANPTSNSNKPSAGPSSNNPFNRSQTTNSDQANVIAMARKRLLANNALESAKLKQQQQNKPQV